jgi:arabinofuranan 3-O-arabinosyltransferase
MTITQPGGDHSPITGLRVTAGAVSADVTVTPADASGSSTVAFPETLPAGPVQLTILGADPHSVLDRRYGEPVVEPAAISALSGIVPTTIPGSFDSGCRDDLVTIDARPLPIRVQGTTAALLAGDPVSAEPCDGSALALTRGSHLLATAKGLDSGLDIDRVVFAAPDRPTPGAAANGPTATVTSQSRTDRKVTVDRCPDGCWLILGEGFHDSWSASTPAGSLGPPQLVDGGFNGWWIPPSAGPVAVSVHWTAQPPLTIALILTALAILACLLLVALDRRSAPALVTAAPTFAPIGRPIPTRRRWIAAATWVVAAVLLVGPGWALVAALAAAVLLVVLGRPRTVGWVSVGILIVMGAVVAWVVQHERPYPDAGWPVRFEWLHGLGLFAAVSLAIVAFAGHRTERRGGDADPAP